MPGNVNAENKSLQSVTTHEEFGKLIPRIAAEANRDQKLALLFFSSPLLAFKRAGYELSDELKQHVLHSIGFETKEAPESLIDKIDAEGRIPWIDNVHFGKQAEAGAPIKTAIVRSASTDAGVAGYDLVLEVRRSLLENTLLAAHNAHAYDNKILYCNNPDRYITLDRPHVLFDNTLQPGQLRIKFRFSAEVFCALAQTVEGEFVGVVEIQVQKDGQGNPQAAYVDLGAVESITINSIPLKTFVSLLKLDPNASQQYPPEFLEDADGYVRGKIVELLKKADKINLTPLLSPLVGYDLHVGKIERKALDNPANAEDALAVAVNFDPSSPSNSFPPSNAKGDLAQLGSFLHPNSDISVGIHERMFQYFFKQQFDQMPKRYNDSGQASSSGNIVINSLSLDFRDGFIRLEGSITREIDCWPDATVSFSGDIYLSVVKSNVLDAADQQALKSAVMQVSNISEQEYNTLYPKLLQHGIPKLVYELKNISDSTPWWVEFASWFVGSLTEGAIADKIRGVMLEQVNSMLGDTYLLSVLQIPGTDFKVILGADSLSLHGAHMQVDWSAVQVSPALVEPFWPPVAQLPSVSITGALSAGPTALVGNYDELVQHLSAADMEKIKARYHDLLSTPDPLHPGQPIPVPDAEWWEKITTWHETGKTYKVNQFQGTYVAHPFRIGSPQVYAWRLDGSALPGANPTVILTITPPAGFQATAGANQDYSHFSKTLKVTVHPGLDPTYLVASETAVAGYYTYNVINTVYPTDDAKVVQELKKLIMQRQLWWALQNIDPKLYPEFHIGPWPEPDPRQVLTDSQLWDPVMQAAAQAILENNRIYAQQEARRNAYAGSANQWRAQEILAAQVARRRQ